MFTSIEAQGPVHNHSDLHLLVTFLHPIRDINLLSNSLKLNTFLVFVFVFAFVLVFHGFALASNMNVT